MLKLSWVPKTLRCMFTNTQPLAGPCSWARSWDAGVWLHQSFGGWEGEQLGGEPGAPLRPLLCGALSQG